MAAVLLPNGKQQYLYANGTPLVGGTVETYITGTTTPKLTWRDAAQTQANTNPIILDARGEAPIFWSGAYRVVVKDALGNMIWTMDGISTQDYGAGILADLADSTTSTKGAGMVGFGPGVAYPASTVGGFLRSVYGRTAYEISAGVTPVNWNYLPYNLLRYGAVGNGSTDDSTAIANFWAAIPLDGAGYIPAAPAGAYYVQSTAVVRAARVGRVYGDGLRSRIHYTGNGVGLTLQEGRFCEFQTWYMTGTVAAAGGVYIQKAQECFATVDWYIDSFLGVGAYAMRFSDSWDVTMRGGAIRQSRTGLWFDSTNLGDGGINNQINLIGIDMSACEVNLKWQSGDGLSVNGCDFTQSPGVITPVCAIEIGCDVAASIHCRSVSIENCWFESGGDGVAVGRNNTSTDTPTNVKIGRNFFANTGTHHVRFYKANAPEVYNSTWGTGNVQFDAGVTNGRCDARGVTIVDNTTNQIGYYQYDQAIVNTINSRQAFVMSGVLTPAALTVNTNDYNPTGWSTSNVLRLSSTGAVDLTGIVPFTANSAFLLINVGTATITLKHDVTSTAANRFLLAGAADDPVVRNGMRWVFRDNISGRWFVSGT